MSRGPISSAANHKEQTAQQQSKGKLRDSNPSEQNSGGINLAEDPGSESLSEHALCQLGGDNEQTDGQKRLFKHGGCRRTPMRP